MIDTNLYQDAIEEFKAEQSRRVIEDVKSKFRKVVHFLHEIQNAEANIADIFEDLGFQLTDEFRTFLESVEDYGDLVFTITASGNIGIGTTSPSSAFYVLDDSGTIRVQ